MNYKTTGSKQMTLSSSYKKKTVRQKRITISLIFNKLAKFYVRLTELVYRCIASNLEQKFLENHIEISMPFKGYSLEIAHVATSSSLPNTKRESYSSCERRQFFLIPIKSHFVLI